MNDLISRQAAIQALDNAAEHWNIAEPYHEGIRAGFRNSARLIMSLPSAQPEQQWISCSERLPDKNGRYLITGKRDTVYSLEYEDGRWYGGIKPVAWMPLPEPYKGGRDE